MVLQEAVIHRAVGSLGGESYLVLELGVCQRVLVPKTWEKISISICFASLIAYLISLVVVT